MSHLLIVFGALACLSLGFAAGMMMSGHSEGHTRTVVQVLSVAGGNEPAYTEAAKANVRAAVPAVEAYNADNVRAGEHSGYWGMTLDRLRAYDSTINVDVRLANAASYCVESTVGSATWSKSGPGADINPESCG